MKRLIVILLPLLLLLAACLSGCKADASVTLHEPRYAGEAANGKPSFELKWNRAAGSKSYAVAIYAETEGFTDRQELGVYEGRNSKTIVLLQGVYTDTITYRIKVRPSKDGAVWSNIWEIRFVNGEYTVAKTTADFDAPKAATPTPDPAKTPKPAKAPVAHSFPETLWAFRQKADGREALDLSQAATLRVVVNHCLYGEPMQCITDSQVIAAVIEALDGITVTGDHDSLASTGTYYAYSLYDAEDRPICSFAFQDGMLMENEGRYPVSGLSGLLSVEGVKLDADWEAYWEANSEKQEAYEAAFVPAYPLSVFAAGGYETSRLAAMDPSELVSAGVYISWNDSAGKLLSDDPAVIRSLYDALSAMQVTGESTAENQGQTWYITFSFVHPEEGYIDSASLCFVGDALEGRFSSGNRSFTVSGLDALFSAADADVLRYLAEKRTTPRLKPVY